ncbi:MAG: type II toxin-antitoxin system RelE/ParE family toxin [Flavobacteriales bacterium]|nr:type II toxin-antitoxin system RelE/ParE family toxin [Flavobacteriales bacterium]
MDKIEDKARSKIIYNIDKARYINDPKLFKKLDDEIWELREESSLAFATHGFVKKVSKVPKEELKKAHKLRTEYLKHN